MNNYLSLIILSMGIAFSSSCRGEVVNMAFGDKIPPFCFPETHSGIEIEVIREALAIKGHILKPQYYPLARVPIMFKKKLVDAAMTDLGVNLSKFGGHYGSPAVFYDNVFITLKEKNIVIKKPEDLKGLSVTSFQGAILRYPKWLTQVNKDGLYHSKSNQLLQVKALFNKRFDVVLSDRNIFKYNSNLVKRENSIKIQPIVEHSFTLLNQNDYRPIFRSIKVRDDFNIGLKKIKENGTFKAIYDKYLK